MEDQTAFPAHAQNILTSCKNQIRRICNKTPDY